MPDALTLVATCALGLEELLEGELRALGVDGVVRHRGAVGLSGDWSTVWRCNWRLRTANRVLVRLGEWDGADGEALAAGARRLLRSETLSWGGLASRELFHPDRTLSLRATSSASKVRDVRWVGLTVKDGLVDGQRAVYGRRSSVDRHSPDLPLRVLLRRDRATLLLDTSGNSLDRRGYRAETAGAPVRETLAAACVLASGWDGLGPVVDPMCGSGTLLIEAAWYALGRSPGALRAGWAFQRLPNFDPGRFRAIRKEPIPVPGPEVGLVGVDPSSEALAAARKNLLRADLQERVTLRRGDGFQLRAPAERGLIVVNPPYGERQARSPEQWKRLGDLFKQQFSGWKAVVLAGGSDRGKHIGLRPSFRLPVRNGPLDARILGFDLY